LEFLLFYQLLYQTYRSSLYESNFLNPFIAYLPCFAFMQRPLLSIYLLLFNALNRIVITYTPSTALDLNE
ncbi:hypothetical protein, partial [Candidatus Bandiella numerosa]|uniref:hypothetical protein n=1 Tax=Candidatus Bandiella numerosa TaxID=2570586 RepID=UPI001F268B4B